MLENPWSAVGNPTSALSPSDSSFGPASLMTAGIHHLLLSNLTTVDDTDPRASKRLLVTERGTKQAEAKRRTFTATSHQHSTDGDSDVMTDRRGCLSDMKIIASGSEQRLPDSAWISWPL